MFLRSAVPDVLRRGRDRYRLSAKKDELDKYLDIARITGLSRRPSDDVEESKPAPDIFEVNLLTIEGADAVAIGDTPYDATAARKAGISAIGVLCRGSQNNRTTSRMCRDIPGTGDAVSLASRALLAT
jgi:phosphoglycolate phosphatase-like HAD superfamily hydrolase